MKKFLVRLVFRIHRGSREKKTTFDSQFRIILAEDEAQAWSKATITGLNEEGEVKPDYEGHLRWEFSGIEMILDLDNYDDRAILFSSTQRRADPDAYTQYLNIKMMEGEKSPL